MVITWPSNTREIINEIRHAIGRDVTFVTATYSGCPICGLDPVTNTSTDSFCPTCSGNYWIPIYSDYTVSGHVTWNGHDQLGWVTGGQIFEGDCRVQVEFTDEMVTVLDNVKWVEVDDKILQVKKRTYRGVQPLNRILVDLIEKES